MAARGARHPVAVAVALALLAWPLSAASLGETIQPGEWYSGIGYVSPTGRVTATLGAVLAGATVGSWLGGFAIRRGRRALGVWFALWGGWTAAVVALPVLPALLALDFRISSGGYFDFTFFDSDNAASGLVALMFGVLQSVAVIIDAPLRWIGSLLGGSDYQTDKHWFLVAAVVLVGGLLLLALAQRLRFGIRGRLGLLVPLPLLALHIFFGLPSAVLLYVGVAIWASVVARPAPPSRPLAEPVERSLRGVGDGQRAR